MLFHLQLLYNSKIFLFTIPINAVIRPVESQVGARE